MLNYCRRLAFDHGSSLQDPRTDDEGLHQQFSVGCFFYHVSA